MKTYNWEGVNPDCYFLDKLEPIPSALPSFQKLFQCWSFFFTDPATTEISTLSLHDALPISTTRRSGASAEPSGRTRRSIRASRRAEEHTSELQACEERVGRHLPAQKKK